MKTSKYWIHLENRLTPLMIKRTTGESYKKPELDIHGYYQVLLIRFGTGYHIWV